MEVRSSGNEDNRNQVCKGPVAEGGDTVKGS